ncbi:hypothetical protein [Agrobacterium sp. S7/73]|uniref:hypothetical protein n=1 Tax=Agrobacterium sp. S7/73 TaxID=2820002 RepID=UPI001C5A80FB|nr:hypothetical protein [Agrobacterium sp. S7/73]QXZ73964.1 hypothetical protein J5276_15245 [Agrobacterium sp. S7/73]
MPPRLIADRMGSVIRLNKLSPDLFSGIAVGQLRRFPRPKADHFGKETKQRVFHTALLRPVADLSVEIGIVYDQRDGLREDRKSWPTVGEAGTKLVEGSDRIAEGSRAADNALVAPGWEHCAGACPAVDHKRQSCLARERDRQCRDRSRLQCLADRRVDDTKSLSCKTVGRPVLDIVDSRNRVWMPRKQEGLDDDECRRRV